LLGAYPVDLFAGAIRVVLFTVIPAAFISAVPAQLVEDFELGRALALTAVATLLALAAGATFTAGLRRYTSGSIWTRA
jgi:ABC-2 type transport system permease protein